MVSDTAKFVAVWEKRDGVWKVLENSWSSNPPAVAHSVRRWRRVRRRWLVWPYDTGYISHMKKASVSRAKDQLSALIKQVHSGESVVITDRGVPVAELVPVRMGTGVPPRILGLAQEGLARLPEMAPDAAWLELPRPVPAPGRAAADILVDERRSGR